MELLLSAAATLSQLPGYDADSIVALRVFEYSCARRKQFKSHKGSSAHHA